MSQTLPIEEYDKRVAIAVKDVLSQCDLLKGHEYTADVFTVNESAEYFVEVQCPDLAGIDNLEYELAEYVENTVNATMKDVNLAGNFFNIYLEGREVL